MKLSVKAFALTSGILLGAAVFRVTLWLIAFGYEGAIMRQLDHFTSATASRLSGP